MRPAASLITALLIGGSLTQAQPPAPPPQAGAAVTEPTLTGPTVVLRRLPTSADPAASPVCPLPGAALPDRRRVVFVLDAGSIGDPGVFGRLKVAMNSYVQAREPDRVELVTLDGEPRRYRWPGEARRWEADLAALRAGEAGETASGSALWRRLERTLSALGAPGKDVTTVFVLTGGPAGEMDGSATVAAPTPREALKAFRGRGLFDTLHYVSLGAEIPRGTRLGLRASGYAQALAVPVGRVPDLLTLAPPPRALTVTRPARVPVALPDGTPVTLRARQDRIRLVTNRVQGGAVRLSVLPDVPYGSRALLCAPPLRPGGLPRRVLLTLRLGPAPGLTLLNPAVDPTLAPGETVTLRYRVPPGTPPGRLILPPGLRGEGLGLPGARDRAVRLTNTGLAPGQSGRPRLAFGSARPVALPRIHGAVSRAAASAGPAPTGTSGAPLLIAGGLLVLGGLGAAGRLLQKRRTRPVPVAGPPATSVPTVEGLRYGEDRTLAVVGRGGMETSVAFPLGGPFDLGQQARVPHLSGLRLQQKREGLHILRLPGDLEVSQGTRLLRAEDIIRPGSLLGVAVARGARAPHPPLGSLVGLGLPLRLRADGITLRVVGPYGDHALTLRPGITDLGAAFGASAIGGLMVTPSGPNVLLATVPPGVRLRRAGDGAQLRPGTYLREEVWLELGE